MTANENSPDRPLPRRREPSVRGVRVWMDLMATCEQLLLARLQHQAGPGGDLAAAYRAWNRRQMERRDRERRQRGVGHAV